ncbi:MAG: 4'-phosphopantetheinyl transferase superfamily protein [Clostridia bacterium]|nr:4'-phosphopantetheinyl transferase superfamily protein [Clostridia bacterium]
MTLRNGIDMERIGRFSEILKNEHFCARVFTERERSHIETSGHPAAAAAGIFCAKEAVSKALGRGLFGLLPREIALDWTESGAPFVTLTGSAARQYGAWQLAVSVTHTGDYAAACCTALLQEE